MREPKIYAPTDGSPRWSVTWYEQGIRQRKNFTDEFQAAAFHQEKVVRHPVDKSDLILKRSGLILKEVTTLKRYVPGLVHELEKENARLKAEIAQLVRKAPTRSSQNDPQPRMRNQSINLPALRWAYEQDDLSVTAKAVLMTFAIHSNKSGYSWPGVDRIASTWGMDRDTVRRQIKVLLVRRKIYETKKRCGSTGRVKVYRLPKITYEMGAKFPPFENDKSQTKAGDNRRTIGGESAPNKEQRNKEQNAAGGIADLQRAQLYAIAATATDWSELVEKLKPHFPSHDVRLEMRDYRKNRDRHSRPITSQTFVDWMLRAHKRLGPPMCLSLPAEPAAAVPPRCSFEIDEQHALFLKQMEDRKSRKTASANGRLRSRTAHTSRSPAGRAVKKIQDAGS